MSQKLHSSLLQRYHGLTDLRKRAYFLKEADFLMHCKICDLSPVILFRAKSIDCESVILKPLPPARHQRTCRSKPLVSNNQAVIFAPRKRNLVQYNIPRQTQQRSNGVKINKPTNRAVVQHQRVIVSVLNN